METTVLQPQGTELFEQPEMSLETKSSSEPLDKSSGCLNQDFSHRSLWAEETGSHSMLALLTHCEIINGYSFPLVYLLWMREMCEVFFWDLFIYFISWLWWVFVAVLGPSLVSLVSESGVYALSQWAGFSLCLFPSLQSPGSQGAWAQELWCPRQVGSSWTRDLTGVPCTARQILNHGNTRKPNFLIFNWRRIITLGWFLQLFFVFNNTLGTSLEVQWLGLRLPVLGEAGVVVEVVVSRLDPWSESWDPMCFVANGKGIEQGEHCNKVNADLKNSPY